VGDYQFKYTIDGWNAQETVPAECATDNNRAFTVAGTSPVVIETVAYGACDGGDDPDVDTVDTTVTFQVYLPAGTATARLHSEALGWDLNHGDGVAEKLGDVAVDGDEIWVATIPAPWTAGANYKWYVDGAEEDLLPDSTAGFCTNEGLNAWDNGANRVYAGSGSVTGETFGECSGNPSNTVVRVTAAIIGGVTDSARLHADAFGWDVNHADGRAVSNGDGTWTASVFGPWDANVNYKWRVDGAEEDLTGDAAAGYCDTPDFNYADWGANRLHDGSSQYVEGQVFGECSGNPSVHFTVKAPSDATTVRLHSEAFGWDPAHGDGPAVANGDGTWTASIPAAWGADVNYKWMADGAEEDLTDDAAAGYCDTPDFNYGDWGANRLYSGTGHLVVGMTFGECPYTDTP
jgi:hypothetical protein